MGEGLLAECKEGCILSQLKVNIFLYFYLIDSLVKKLNTSTPKSTLMVLQELGSCRRSLPTFPQAVLVGEELPESRLVTEECLD
jgi:hypothetical protein